jgi:FKBP-type peptidyl-prolyl cis-trans isomerase
MTHTNAIRSMIALGATLLVGTVLAQSPPAENKTQEQAPVVQVEPKADKGDKSPAAEPAFKSRKEKLSYAFGADLARNLKRQRMDLDLDLLVKALRDAMAGNKLLMTNDEMVATMTTFQEERKQDFDHARTMVSAKNKKAGEEFFAQNVKKEGVVTLPSGLQYKILKQGDGKIPTLEDKVVCSYRGTLLDGREFDNSSKRDHPPTVPVKGLLKGWSEALQLMPVGSKWQLFIPPQLGYGERVVGGIGPNSMLLFEVELISIEEKPQSVEDKPQGAAGKSHGSS